MPYKVFQEGSGYCVYKVDENGHKMGRSMSRMPLSKARAESQMRALYASEKGDGMKSIFVPGREMIIYFGTETLKAVEATDGMIGGQSIIYGDNTAKDFHGNWFEKSTFLGHNRGNGAVATFNHRVPFFKKGQFDPAVEKELRGMVGRTLKNPIKTTENAQGLFSELVCDLSDEYEKMVYALAKAGKLKWSSGTAPQLYDADPSGALKMFVIAEQALTPAPAEYRMLEHRVMPLKAYTEFLAQHL